MRVQAKGRVVGLALAVALASTVSAAIVVVSAAGLRNANAAVSLSEAVRNKDRETVRTLIKSKADVNAPDPDGATALHWAVRADDLETAELLIRSGANVNAANDYGVTPLSLACINRSGAMVSKLLAARADPHAATSMGETNLMTCARTGSVDAVKALLDRGATNVNAPEASRGQTALMWAAAGGHAEIVKMLLEHGADVRARTKTHLLLVSLGGRRRGAYAEGGEGNLELGGFTALLFVARQGNVESAKLLLDAGADVNERSPIGESALVIASFSGNSKVAAYLLERGADPNFAGAGYGALHTAVLRGDAELVKTLLAHKANPNIRLTKGSRVPRSNNWWVLPGSLAGATPFMLATKYAEVDLMRILVSSGADPRLSLTDGTTALMMAAGAMWPNRESDRRDRAIPSDAAIRMTADERPNLEVTKLVLELRADVNAQNDNGQTALHAAVYKGWAGVVQLLVDHGGDMTIKDKRAKTPKDLMCFEDKKLVICPEIL